MVTKHYGSDRCPICCAEDKDQTANMALIEDSCVWCWGPRLVKTLILPFPAATLRLTKVVSGDFGDYS